ncbi:MAG TPA: hypothetical protein VM597_19610, partial [Gemmataceae bacterium]|nr:hypothetical protein [Gemmataceae bacterium]
LVLAAAPVRADDARAVVEKALKAHGGAETLAKFPAVTVGFKGTFHGMGQEIPMTGQVTSQGVDRIKMDMEIEAGGQKIRVVNVITKDAGWTKVADNLMELGKDQLAEGLAQAHAGYVATLVPLKDKAYTLASTGEIKVNEKPAVGVKVSTKGQRDVTLYFDKESGLLVKSEHLVKDEGSGQEVQEETFYADYKEVQGTKQAMKFKVNRDGKLFMEGEATEYHLSEKLDDNTFAKP